MNGMNTYLNFDGNCREAMTFYRDCLGAELQVMPWGDFKGVCDVPESAKDRVMHARLTRGKAILMASDCPPGMPLQQGNNFTINIDCESKEEIEKFFHALGQGGQVRMPLQDMFWGSHFGMITDKFGINWMFNYELPKQG